MKAFLFLYPIEHYFEQALEDFAPSKIKKINLERLNEIIDARYRQKNYNIFWLMFSKKEDYLMPDLSIASKFIKFDKKDPIISAGISLHEHTTEFKYPALGFIFDQLPKMTELVVGGFHQWDCVNKVAKYAYDKKIPVTVDEDVTELFFERIFLKKGIPLFREKIMMEDLGMSSELELGFYRKMREGKPWFVRVL